VEANLVKGLEENYASLGQHWPDNRYVVISLSATTVKTPRPKRK
jgi:hypothetical protein